VPKLTFLVIAMIAAAIVASPIGASGSKTSVSVRLKEFKVLPSPLTAKRGPVSFAVKNTGKVNHEFVVLKTNTAPAKLRVKSGKAVEVGRVGETGALKPGRSRTLTLTLKAGKYILLCNLSGHYQAGQRIGFGVS
jgi:uncharacterized cupredoxin-like copper-binding protein